MISRLTRYSHRNLVQSLPVHVQSHKSPAAATVWHTHSAIRDSASYTTSTVESNKNKNGHWKKRQVIYSGIQPTGVPHLGNYLGALRHWLTLQNEHLSASTSPSSPFSASSSPLSPCSLSRSSRSSSSSPTTLIYCIVDLHAITVPQPAARLAQHKTELLAALLAIGLDPQRCILYHQSSVPQHAELAWILSTLAPIGALSRMTQFKSKSSPSSLSPSSSSTFSSPSSSPSSSSIIAAGSSALSSDQERSNLGLFAYPVLQAADILLYKTTLVPVGEDQAQHLELSRTLARSLNTRLGYKRDDQARFPMPETLLGSSAARVSSLRDPMKKMSKSAQDEKSRISILDEPDVIRKKIASAVTDSTMGITLSSERPGIANLLEIYTHLSGTHESPESVAREMAPLSHKDFKQVVAEVVVDALKPIRERYRALDITSTAGAQYMDQVAQDGADRARSIAQETMAEVRSRLGLS